VKRRRRYFSKSPEGFVWRCETSGAIHLDYCGVTLTCDEEAARSWLEKMSAEWDGCPGCDRVQSGDSCEVARIAADYFPALREALRLLLECEDRNASDAKFIGSAATGAIQSGKKAEQT
jgi:hypothetical protein